MPILLDVESKSRADLTECGGRLYWEHPSTSVLCVVLHDTDTGERGVWLPGDPAPELGDAELGAHNWSGFDRFAVAWLGWRPLSYATGIDTSEAARMAGLPGSLDALAKRWLGREKDKVASEFTKRLSQTRRPAGKKVRGVWSDDRISPEVWRQLTAAEKRECGVQPVVTADALARVVAYCDSDVDIMVGGWPLLEPFAAYEPEVRAVDRAVNDRGVAFDTQLAARLLECDAVNADRACAAAARELGWTAAKVREVAGSPEQFAEVTGLADARKGTLDAYEANGARGALPGFERAWLPLVAARRALASIARGKLEAGCARTSADGRLRDSHRYVGAHPWRWAGKGIQPQNFPRPAKRFEAWEDDEICAAIDAVLAGAHADPELIDVLLRACLCAGPGRTLAVCDYTGVESRALGWLAGDENTLDVIASGRDAYKAAATDVYGVAYEDVDKTQRQVGKVAVLALGYQGGPRAFEKMAVTSGVSLEGVDVPDVVASWRRAHAATVQFWYALERAFVRAAMGSEARLGPLTLMPSDDGKDVAIFLPDDRPIVYNDVRIRRDERGRPKVSYAPMAGGPGTYVDPHTGELRADTYGGKLTQNVIEGICRELLAAALAAAEDAGLDPVLHVHDEIACEVPANAGEEGLAELRRIMLHIPDWAEGFPIGCAGHVGARYRK